MACAGSIVNATPVFLSRMVSGGVTMTQKTFSSTEINFFFLSGGCGDFMPLSTVLCMRITTRAEKEKKIGDMNVHVPQTTSS